MGGILKLWDPETMGGNEVEAESERVSVLPEGLIGKAELALGGT